MKLTDSQKKAVAFLDGNALINAGSGAGKTSVLTARVANLIGNRGADPKRILALTFTKEATNNMRDRLKDIVGDKADSVNINTFHSFAYRIMRARFPHLYKNKTIIQGWWKTRKMFDLVAYPTSKNTLGIGMSIKAGDLESFISFQKSNMVKQGMDVIIDEERQPFLIGEHPSKLQKAFDTYCSHVEFARLIEFDDMLVDFYYKLADDKSFLEEIKGSYDYVLVDEFQDTNTINLEIIRKISENNLFAVGDFRQGIYGFINANIDNILNFSETFEDVEIIELQENFRSTKNIVDFANDIIDVAPVEKYKSFGKQIPARGEDGDKVKFVFFQNDYDETVSIGERIIELVESGDYNYNDFSILYRTNAQLGIYESEFTELEIPVDVSSSYSFFDRKEISDLLSYAEHALNQDDDMSMRKVMNSPNRYISNAIISEIDEHAYKNGISFERACSTFDSGRYKSRISSVVLVFNQLRDHLDANASQFLEQIYRATGYGEYINKSAKTNSELELKLDSVNRLFELSKRFSSIKSFLGHVSIIRQNAKKNVEGVKLMTVHGSKGLEFKYVFIPSVIDGNYPHEMNSDYEEERRLFYVACTRAKDNMVLSAPVFTPNGSEMYDLSPFVNDMCGDKLEGVRKSMMYGATSTEYEYDTADNKVSI